ncbi:thioredoxin-like protein [Lineolata rhizophorae]|uniref:Thioredoxin-like protein n=1 Tax=Lineolata rhizophorae TaxID=578093 RepID=A0A6A6PE09_9PEZI|nr:thioredoxin-like protein [Lineolata rhizophorae]
MGYDSQISFTLDTICPWTYLAKRRLSKALDQVRSSNPSSPVTFHVKFMPYQLYPDASKEGEAKYSWYKRAKYNDSEEKMKMYMTLMSAYGANEDIDFKFGGTVANTLDAHRLIQWVQEENGEEQASKVVDSLYSQYFENEKHPSASETLLKAATDAGIPENKAKGFIDDEYEGLLDVKMLIREQAANGVDAVPHVIVEGKRRDFTLEGAKDVEEYVKTLEQVIKESG